MASVADRPVVPPLVNLCIRTLSNHLHLLECISTLPDHIASQLWSQVEKLLTYKHGKLNDDGFQNFLALVAFNVYKETKQGDGGEDTLQRLSGLNLPWCRQITDDSMPLITQFCPNLVYLDLSYCEKIDDPGVIELAKNLKNLSSIALTFTKAGDRGVKMLVERCKCLTALNLEVYNNLTDTGVQAIAWASRSKMVQLNLGGCSKLTNISFQILGEHLKGLGKLNLSGCGSLIDFDIEDVCRNCVALHTLILRACWRLTDHSAKHIGLLGKRKEARRKKLRQYNEEFTTPAIGEPCHLKMLDLGGCSRLTVKGLGFLLKFNPFMEELDLRGLNIDGEFLCNNLVYLNRLRSLNLLGMRNLKEEHVSAFQEHRKRLCSGADLDKKYLPCHLSVSFVSEKV